MRKVDAKGEAELLAGPRAVLEALRAGRRSVRRLVLARQESGDALDSILELARARHLPMEIRPRGELDQLLRGATHQGVVAEVSPFPYAEAEAIVARAVGGDEPAFLVVLDGIQDPQNLGAIVRTAEAAGVHGLVLPRDRAAPVSPAVVRASAGATEHLPIAQVTNLATFLEGLKGQGVWVVGADAEGGQELFRTDLAGPLALVIGAEGRGLRALTRRRCDLLVRIPSRGRVASLNAAAAAAVCIFEGVRQRGRWVTKRDEPGRS